MVVHGGAYWIDLDKRRPRVIAGNVLLRSTVTGLPRDSVAVPLGLELIDRSLLAEPSGRVPHVLLDDIDDGPG